MIKIYRVLEYCAIGFSLHPMAGVSDDRGQNALQALLRELRTKAGLRQVDVAKAAGMPQSVVSKYEVGERRLDILEIRTLCRVFGISLSQFVKLLEAKIEEPR